eukprot:2368508-Ditylum_brightwellii.AAC.1
MTRRPLTKDLFHVINIISIKNCPVTVENSRVAKKESGKDMGPLKEKTTRFTPNLIVLDCMSVHTKLRESHSNASVVSDQMYINASSVQKA